ncbi:NTP transferase domain-containing protein, partial [Faecalicoccus pleomorphus]|uniref:sugar phosphate nucleotidyltransferase n=1 Tax=Faecalicoccus pleomorphus TaxID=1323 RepID=UPI0019617B77
EPYQVKQAIIIAAGLGSRMLPATKDTPKPLVEVNGRRIIETLLDALVAAEIKDITVIVGYQRQKVKSLLANYPF